MEAFCKAFFPFFFDGFVVGSRDSFLVLETKHHQVLLFFCFSACFDRRGLGEATKNANHVHGFDFFQVFFLFQDHFFRSEKRMNSCGSLNHPQEFLSFTRYPGSPSPPICPKIVRIGNPGSMDHPKDQPLCLVDWTFKEFTPLKL